jgi:four helix bundle protein
MGKIESFEDILAWQKARTLNLEIYKISNRPDFSRDFGLRDQMRRASISVLSNIAEGFERKSKAEFSQFLNIAKGSAGELRAQLYVALDLNYISGEEFTSLYKTTVEVSKMISGFMSYLKPTSQTKTVN